MGKIHDGNGWIIKVHGDEHSPVHVHVLPPDGKATIALDGTVQIAAEWARMNNPRRR